MRKIIYKASYGYDSKWYADGPGDGCGYYNGTSRPSLRCDTQEEAEKLARIANIAYAEGYKAAQLDIKKALGI